MNQGCHGATVEMHGTLLDLALVETGLVVSGVEATSIRLTLSSTISSLGDFGGAVGIGLAVLDDDLDRIVRAADVEAVLDASRKPPMMNSSASAKAASGPVCGLT